LSMLAGRFTRYLVWGWLTGLVFWDAYLPLQLIYRQLLCVYLGNLP
jgi:hypothetical protein